MEVVVWYGLVAPGNTPAAVIARIADAVAKISQQPDMVQRLRNLGNDPVGRTPEQFSKLIRDEIPIWAKVVKAAGMTAD